MSDDNIEARLARWRPAKPPLELMRRLHAAAPPVQKKRWTWRSASGWLDGWSCQPWPLAYAGLLAAWTLILVLRLLTPSDPEVASPVSTAKIDHALTDAPAFVGTLAAERTFLLAHNTPDQL